MRKRKVRNQESGMALLIALLALLLVSAIGMGMMYMSTTETSVNANYRDTQRAFFSMRAGLEEMRDRMRSNAVSAITLPTNMPTNGTASSVVYILNQAGSSDSTVSPTTYGNTYFDDEFCHETFSTMTGLSTTNGVCAASGAVPSTAVTTYTSVMAYNGTSSALNYKWVRITLKQNGTLAAVDSLQPASSQVCWNTATNNEVAVTALGSYTTCDAALNAGFMVEPVYIITSLAYTPQGSRRMGQYEVAALTITPPPSALALDGSGVNFNPPNSNNGSIDGINGSGSPPAVAGCSTSSPVSVPAIGTSDSTDQATVVSDIPSGRITSYPGSTASPSVVDMGSDAGGTNQLSNWSTPAQLNALAAMMADGADATYTCSINGTAQGTATSACSGSYGTDANPQISYVNGDVTVNGGAGVLVVTGTMTISGTMQFDGLILVIGQGSVQINGGGSGTINGSILVANTNNSTAPFAQLAALGTPAFQWHGGGSAIINYNSCWATIGNKLHYMVVSSREEMY
jgi:Tfp pilus assembly protein PilX